MARLAAEAGLGQSSLYYYYRSKDDVLAALVTRANVVPLDLIEQLSKRDVSPAAKLLAFVCGDVEALCGLPFDINEVHRIAARDRDRFAGYWTERAAARAPPSCHRAPRHGDRRTPAARPRLVALTIMSNDEGVQNWYRLGTSRRPATSAERSQT